MSRMHALSLYRKIMRLHRQKLPEIHREIGDKYVRQEFRAHRDAKEDQTEQFIRQWEDYSAHLMTEADLFGVGRDLPDAEIESLSDDQKAQLHKLRESAVSIGIQAQAEAGENPYDSRKS